MLVLLWRYYSSYSSSVYMFAVSSYTECVCVCVYLFQVWLVYHHLQCVLAASLVCVRVLAV